MQSRLSLRTVPTPGTNFNSKIYNCAPNPTLKRADQEFLESQNPLPFPPNPKNFKPRLPEDSYKKISTYLTSNKDDIISLPTSLIENPSSTFPNIMEEKENPLILIPISKTISLEENFESIPSSAPDRQTSL